MRSFLSRFMPWLALSLMLAAPAWSAPAADERALAEEILRLTNAQRAAVGAPALTLDTGSLAAAARSHSQEMSQLGYFSHTSPNPARKSVKERVRLAGGADSTLGENLYHGPAEPALQGASSAVTGFMNSPGHRRAMLNPEYNVLGLGIVRQNGRMHVTEVFASRPIALDVQSRPAGDRVELTVSGQVLSGERSGALMDGGKVLTRWSADPDGRFTAKLSVPRTSRVQMAQVLGKVGAETRFRIVGELPLAR